MFCSRLILERARAPSPRGSSLTSLHKAILGEPGLRRMFVQWSGVQNHSHFFNSGVTLPRRPLSDGRRHGWKEGSEEKPKSNFAEVYLKPAARGELKEKHTSGIPNLAVRKHKGHNLQGTCQEDGVSDDEEDLKLNDPSSVRVEGNLVETMNTDITRARAESRYRQEATSGSKDKAFSKNDGPVDLYSVWEEVESERDLEYWREEEFDLLSDRDRALFRERYGNDGSLSGLSKEVLDEIRASGFKWKTPASFKETKDEEKGDKKALTKISSKEKFTMENWEDAWDNDKGEYNGPEFVDFRYFARHPESKREPMPFYPKNRANPHPVILEFYSRWLYVTGLPPAMTETGMNLGGGCKLTVLQKQAIQKMVTRLFGVSLDQVYPANETSAFIGFESPELRDHVAKRGPTDNILFRPVIISLYTPSAEDTDTDFLKGAGEKTILKLEGVPPHRFTRETIARDLFPTGSELGASFPLCREKFLFRSPTTVLLRFDSQEQARSALSSREVAARLVELGQYPVQLFRAHRNVVHDRMEDEFTEIRMQGNHLIVDGDMPSKKFYMSHAGVIMLRNLDRKSASKETISDFFQPFSNVLRDAVGSVEFVTCYNCLPTDRAYVGFERQSEAEAVMKAFKGRAQIGDNMVFFMLVKDRVIPGTPSRVARPERTEEDVLRTLNDWEQYVDPEDVKYLGEHGVTKVIIDETLRGVRYHNRSFGPLDWAMREEKLERHKESGEDYRELVQMYVGLLKGCVGTPANPGEVYQGLHFPGEPIDVSIFETDKGRIRKLLKKGVGR